MVAPLALWPGTTGSGWKGGTATPKLLTGVHGLWFCILNHDSGWFQKEGKKQGESGGDCSNWMPFPESDNEWDMEDEVVSESEEVVLGHRCCCRLASPQLIPCLQGGALICWDSPDQELSPIVSEDPPDDHTSCLSPCLLFLFLHVHLYLSPFPYLSVSVSASLYMKGPRLVPDLGEIADLI